MNYLTAKQFKVKYGCDVSGIHQVIDGRHIIEVPYHTKTLIRLHEVGHAYLDHKPLPDNATIQELFTREIDAEVFAFHKAGKPLTRLVAKPAIRSICAEVHNPHFANCIFGMTINALKYHGIICDRDARSKIWDFIRSFLAYEKSALNYKQIDDE